MTNPSLDYEIVIETACLGNPGAGSFASIIIDAVDGSEVAVIAGKTPRSTHKDLVLTSIIATISKLPKSTNILVWTRNSDIADTVDLLRVWKSDQWLKMKTTLKLETCLQLEREIASRYVQWGLSSNCDKTIIVERCELIARDQLAFDELEISE